MAKAHVADREHKVSNELPVERGTATESELERLRWWIADVAHHRSGRRDPESDHDLDDTLLTAKALCAMRKRLPRR